MLKKLKFGYQTYNIKSFNKAKKKDDNLDGLLVPDTNTVYIDSDLVDTKQETALAHEIMHIIVLESGAREILKNKEEEFVAGVEKVFYEFLKTETNFFKRK